MKKSFSLLILIIGLVTFAQAQANLAPKYFDWEKTNADRFVNSPCFKELGFDPFLDPKVQEEKYQHCESAKRNRDLKKVGMIIFWILLVGGVLFFCFRAMNDKEEGLE